MYNPFKPSKKKRNWCRVGGLTLDMSALLAREGGKGTLSNLFDIKFLY